MKVIVAGSREINDYDVVKAAIEQSHFQITEVVCGEARGPDKLGKAWAIANHVSVKSMPADWEKFGRRAGYRRNEEMGDSADALIAVWDGVSKGTKHMIDYMEKLKKPIFIMKIEYNKCIPDPIPSLYDWMQE